MNSGGNTNFLTCAVEVDGVEKILRLEEKAVDRANREPYQLVSARSAGKNNIAIYRYGSVGRHNPRSTATLHSTGFVDSTGRDIGTTPTMNRLLAD